MERGKIEFDDPNFRPVRSNSVIRREAHQQPSKLAADYIALLATARRLRDALEPMQSGEWGAIKAWIVEGAPTREEGIKAAAGLTRLNAMADTLLASPDVQALGLTE